MIKILVIPDLHLYDKELEDQHTAGYAEQSLQILRSIRKVLTEESFDIVVLGGDIQHETLTEFNYISKFFKELHEISKLVTNNTNKPHIRNRLKIIGGDTFKDYTDITEPKLFAIHGQHDQRKDGDFSFYHMLLENNIISNPTTIRIDDVQINLFNHRYDPLTLKSVRLPGVRKLIGIYHNPTQYGGTLSEGNIKITTKSDINNYTNKTGTDTFGKKPKAYTPTQHMVFSNVDYAVMNDVHLPMVDQDIRTFDNKTKVLIPGSLGRTRRNDGRDGNYGQLVIIEVNEISYEITHKYKRIELMPFEELFPDNTMALLEDAYKETTQDIKSAKYDYRSLKESPIKDADGNFTTDGIAWFMSNEDNFRKSVYILYSKHLDKEYPFSIREDHISIIETMVKAYNKKRKPSEKQDNYIKSVVFENYVGVMTQISNENLRRKKCQK